MRILAKIALALTFNYSRPEPPSRTKVRVKVHERFSLIYIEVHRYGTLLTATTRKHL